MRNMAVDDILPRSIGGIRNIFHPVDLVVSVCGQVSIWALTERVFDRVQAYRLEPLIARQYGRVLPVRVHWADTALTQPAYDSMPAVLDRRVRDKKKVFEIARGCHGG
jgi:hypothetical protein